MPGDEDSGAEDLVLSFYPPDMPTDAQLFLVGASSALFLFTASFEDDDASIPEEVADEIDSASEIESAESFDMDTQNGDEEEEEDNWFKST